MFGIFVSNKIYYFMVTLLFFWKRQVSAFELFKRNNPMISLQAFKVTLTAWGNF